MMECTYCHRKIIIRFIVSLINLKEKEIGNFLHLSKSVVSRHLVGEIFRPDIDIYIIEKALGIKIKDYSINE